VNTILKVTSECVLTTLVILAILHKKLLSRKSEWFLLEKKARKYLKEKEGINNVE
jgi:hypothetical protein